MLKCRVRSQRLQKNERHLGQPFHQPKIKHTLRQVVLLALYWAEKVFPKLFPFIVVLKIVREIYVVPESRIG